MPNNQLSSKIFIAYQGVSDIGPSIQIQADVVFPEDLNQSLTNFSICGNASITPSEFSLWRFGSQRNFEQAILKLIASGFRIIYIR